VSDAAFRERLAQVVAYRVRIDGDRYVFVHPSDVELVFPTEPGAEPVAEPSQDPVTPVRCSASMGPFLGGPIYRCERPLGHGGMHREVRPDGQADWWDRV
jgi:hypothetical protein